MCVSHKVPKKNILQSVMSNVLILNYLNAKITKFLYGTRWLIFNIRHIILDEHIILYFVLFKLNAGSYFFRIFTLRITEYPLCVIKSFNISHFAVRSNRPHGYITSLQWRHNGHDGVTNHQPHHCLLNRLFGHRSKKTSKIHVPGTGEFPAQMASNTENVSIWWCHHVEYSQQNRKTMILELLKAFPYL